MPCLSLCLRYLLVFILLRLCLIHAFFAGIIFLKGTFFLNWSVPRIEKHLSCKCTTWWTFTKCTHPCDQHPDWEMEHSRSSWNGSQVTSHPLLSQSNPPSWHLLLQWLLSGFELHVHGMKACVLLCFWVLLLYILSIEFTRVIVCGCS